MMCFLLVSAHVGFGFSAFGADDELPELRKKLASSDYETRRDVFHRFEELGQQRGLNRDEVDLLLPILKSDKDWRIKTRAAVVLPYAAKPEWVKDALLAALKDRDARSSGNGVVPLSAAAGLAKLGDLKTLPALEEWLKFLNDKPDAYPAPLRKSLIDGANKSIADLKEKAKEKAAKKP